MSEPSPVTVETQPFSFAGAIVGPTFLGAILNWGLFCCLAVQVYFYYASSKNDRISLKFLVCFLFLATTVQTSFATYYAWQTIVVPWSKIQVDPRLNDDPFAPFDSFDEATAVLPVIDGIISAAVQIFFSWRIWFLNQTTVGRIFAVLIGIIAVLQFIASLIVFKLGLTITTSSWLAGNFIADVLIASSMLYALRMAQRQSLSKGARTIISRLMVNAVETGAVTVIIAGAGLMLMLVFPSKYSQIAIFILGPLFPNVCLANLNARAQIRRLGDDPQFSTVHTGERDPGSGRANTTLRFAGRFTTLAQSETAEP